MKLLKYEIATDYEIGTEEHPETKREIYQVSVACRDDEFEELYAKVKACSYNGEVIVEEIPDPEPEPASGDVWAELDAAYQEGVNAAYDQ